MEIVESPSLSLSLRQSDTVPLVAENLT